MYRRFALSEILDTLSEPSSKQSLEVEGGSTVTEASLLDANDEPDDEVSSQANDGIDGTSELDERSILGYFVDSNIVTRGSSSDANESSNSADDKDADLNGHEDSPHCVKYENTLGPANDGSDGQSLGSCTEVEARLCIIDKGGSGRVTFIKDNRLILEVGESQEDERPSSSQASTGSSHVVDDVVRETWSPLQELKDFCCVQHENEIYFIGGRHEETGIISNKFFKYDPVKLKWTDLPSLIHARYQACAEVFKDNIVVTGGKRLFGKKALPTTSCEKFCFTKEKWERAGILPEPRYRHACAVNKSAMYISGGFTKNNLPHNNIWLFDGKTFQELDADYHVTMALTRAGHVMVAHASSLYFICGGDVERKPQATISQVFPNLTWTGNSVEMYTPEVSTEVLHAPTVISPYDWTFPVSEHFRSRAGSVQRGSKIFLVGGTDREGKPVRHVDSFDFMTRSWRSEFTLPRGNLKDVWCCILMVVPAKTTIPTDENEDKRSFKMKWIMW